MGSFREALRTLNFMKDEGVFEDYAISGAMALVFWTEPVPTYDLDVLVFMPPGEGQILSLDPLYRWAAVRGWRVEEEHIVIEGVPTQFVPSPNPLSDEAVSSAEPRDYEGVSVRVVRPEYRVALYLQPGAGTAKRRERAAALLRLHSERPRHDSVIQGSGCGRDGSHEPPPAQIRTGGTTASGSCLG